MTEHGYAIRVEDQWIAARASVEWLLDRLADDVGVWREGHLRYLRATNAVNAHGVTTERGLVRCPGCGTGRMVLDDHADRSVLRLELVCGHAVEITANR